MASWTLAWASLLVLGATAATASEETCAAGALCPDLESVDPESVQLLQTGMNIAPAMASDKAGRDDDDDDDDDALLEEEEVEGIDPDWKQQATSKCVKRYGKGRKGKGCITDAFAAKEKEERAVKEKEDKAVKEKAATKEKAAKEKAVKEKEDKNLLILKTVLAPLTKKMQHATKTFAASRGHRETQIGASAKQWQGRVAQISGLEDARFSNLVRMAGATSLTQKTILALDGEELKFVHVKEMTASLKAFNEYDGFVTKSQVDTVCAKTTRELQEQVEGIASRSKHDKTALNQQIDEVIAGVTAQLDAVIATSAERNKWLDQKASQIEARRSGHSMLETKLSSWKGSAVADVLQKQSTSNEEDHKDEEDRKILALAAVAAQTGGQAACKEGQTADAYGNCMCSSLTKCSGDVGECSECCGGMSWYHITGTASCKSVVQQQVEQQPVVPETATEEYVKEKCTIISDAITQKIQELYAAEAMDRKAFDAKMMEMDGNLGQKMATMQATNDGKFHSNSKRLHDLKTQ